MSDSPRIPSGHLLIAAPARLDDACFSVPATRALAALGQVAGARVLCSADQQALWRNLAGIEPLAFVAGQRARAIAGLIQSQQPEFTAALAWEPGEATTAIRKAQIGVKLAASEGDFGRGFTAVAAPQPPGPIEHRVRDFLRAAEILGAKPFDADHFAPVRQGADPPRHSIALVPDSDFGPSHQWPADRWIEVGSELTDRCHLRPTIIGPGPAANALAEALAGAADHLCPVSTGERLEVLSRHRFVVAADGSAPHLASHVGATCMVLFGPGDPHWRRPLGKRHQLVRRHVECAPCRLARCPLDHRCMRELGTAAVLAALARLLDPDD